MDAFSLPARKKMLTGDFDWPGFTKVVALLLHDHTIDLTNEFISDIVADEYPDEEDSSSTNYERVEVTTRTVDDDNAEDIAYLDADEVIFGDGDPSGIDSSTTANLCAFAVEVTDDDDSWIIGYMLTNKDGSPVSPEGSSIKITKHTTRKYGFIGTIPPEGS